MPKFRKKPVVIEAEQWTNKAGSLTAIHALGCADLTFAADGTADLIIPTLEGDHRATVGDYIIRGVKGEFYPCKPDIFEATYEPVEDETGWAQVAREATAEIEAAQYAAPSTSSEPA
jgi:hypothetical protein